LIQNLIEDGKIDFEKELLDRIATLDVEESKEETIVDVREQYQYGTSLSIKDDLYKELFELAKEVISKAKVIIEE